MHRNVWLLSLWGSLALSTLVVSTPGEAQQEPAPQVRAIPGITTDDSFPGGCVSCHVVLPDGMDVRLSTLMGQWTAGVDSLLLALAQSAAPAGVNLAGRHPEASASLKNIPAGCLQCHGRTSRLAPPFATLLHRLHLTGGDQSVFLTAFQGECTYCHKLDLASGAWSIPSGPER